MLVDCGGGTVDIVFHEIDAKGIPSLSLFFYLLSFIFYLLSFIFYLLSFIFYLLSFIFYQFYIRVNNIKYQGTHLNCVHLQVGPGDQRKSIRSSNKYW